MFCLGVLVRAFIAFKHIRSLSGISVFMEDLYIRSRLFSWWGISSSLLQRYTTVRDGWRCFVQSLSRSVCREMLSTFSYNPTCRTFLKLNSSAWTTLYNVWANTEIIALTFQFTTAFCCLEAIRTWMAKRFNYVTKAKGENQSIWSVFLSNSTEKCLVFINQSLRSIMEKPR